MLISEPKRIGPRYSFSFLVAFILLMAITVILSILVKIDRLGPFHTACAACAGGCIAVLLRLGCVCVFAPPAFLLRCCYCQSYLSALSLPLKMAVNTQSVWYHPSLMSVLKSENQKVVLLFSCTVDFYYPHSEQERGRERVCVVPKKCTNSTTGRRKSRV